MFRARETVGRTMICAVKFRLAEHRFVIGKERHRIVSLQRDALLIEVWLRCAMDDNGEREEKNGRKNFAEYFHDELRRRCRGFSSEPTR